MLLFANLAVSPQQRLIFRAVAVLSISPQPSRRSVWFTIPGEAMDKADFTMEDLKDPERLKFLLMK